MILLIVTRNITGITCCSCPESNPGHLACAASAPPQSYDKWRTTNPHNSSIYTAQVVLKCLSLTPGSHSVCAVRSQKLFLPQKYLTLFIPTWGKSSVQPWWYTVMWCYDNMCRLFFSSEHEKWGLGMRLNNTHTQESYCAYFVWVPIILILRYGMYLHAIRNRTQDTWLVQPVFRHRAMINGQPPTLTIPLYILHRWYWNASVSHLAATQYVPSDLRNYFCLRNI